uniref:Uncharacterized protein n=1 Tax=Human herpesvirus 1 TaxID=10298 RepID=A0A2Z4H018_HHV1|nr:hypothetical protein [Human alphaherpesvirus 1]AWW09535.1 hypothetical protein [Human alphaherpesvirus 1]
MSGPNSRHHQLAWYKSPVRPPNHVRQGDGGRMRRAPNNTGLTRKSVAPAPNKDRGSPAV